MGSFPSESREIFDEIGPIFPRFIAEGAIFEEKLNQDREKILDSESDRTQNSGYYSTLKTK